MIYAYTITVVTGRSYRDVGKIYPRGTKISQVFFIDISIIFVRISVKKVSYVKKYCI